MELTTKGRYAVMALTDLACHADESAVPLSLIAERQHLPLAYLEQIFVPLRRAGLVESARGRSGGYRLARPSSEISIAAVMAAVEEQTRFTRCSDNDPRCSAATPCLTHGLWNALSEATSRFLASVSLADVVGDGKYSVRLPKSSQRGHAAARTYLDHNATAPLRPEARAAMTAALDVVGNPSSVHAEGRRARSIIEDAREKVARLVGASPDEVFFTSSATEANNWVVKAGWDGKLVPRIEHDSLFEPVSADPRAVTWWPLDGSQVDIAFLRTHIEADAQAGRQLVAVQFANNETGVLQPLDEVTALVADAGNVWVHTDAAQAAGRLPVSFRALGVHSMVVSAHKLGGPQGIGALIVRSGQSLPRFISGGGQEKRMRGGTENVAAIAGFGAAAEAALRDLADMPRLAAMRDRLEREAIDIAPQTVVVGAGAPRLPNTSCLADPGRSGETMVIAFDLAGIAVSSGAACSSGKVGRSRVLDAMSLPAGVSGSSVRVSLGWNTTDEDIDAFLAAWAAVTAKARSSAEPRVAIGS